MQTKKCTKCQEEKTIDLFHSAKGGKFGKRAECKKCHLLIKPESKPKTICLTCGDLCWSKKDASNRCQKCKNQAAYDSYSKLTLGDKTYDQHKYAKYAYVRYFAKRKAIELGWNKCCKCGYDKTFEVCHIKPISSYPPETLLIEINHPDNLMPLCPNCHWEFDNLK